MSNSARNRNSGNQPPKNGKIPFIGALRPVELIGIGLLLFAAMMYGLSKCSSDKKTAKAPITISDSLSSAQNLSEPVEDEKVNALRRRLYVVMDSLRMRRAPNKDSTTMKILPYGEELIDMGVYENEQTIRISPEISVTEPWIKVKTKDGKVGWVFGGGVRIYPKKRPAPELKKNEDTKNAAESKDKSPTKPDNSKSTNKTR